MAEPKLTLEQRETLVFLKQHAGREGRTAPEIARALGWAVRNTRSRLEGLRGKGLVERFWVPRKRYAPYSYRLTVEGYDALEPTDAS